MPYIAAKDLPVGQEIDLHGLRRVVDVHNRPNNMLLLVTNRGEFDLHKGARVWIPEAPQ